MTIVEAVKTVLLAEKVPMTCEEIYQQILEKKLYSFPAKRPLGVISWEIRRHCCNLEFVSSSPNRIFQLTGYQGKKAQYFLALDDNEKVNEPVLNLQDLEETTDFTPEEKIQQAYALHVDAIREQLQTLIMNNPPSFFEHLVVDLLLKMGYGNGKDGVVVGKPHDGGIDGIIREDRLGLETIYLQAKRYTPGNNIGRREIQSFVGAMQNVNKGVFITTSAFSKEAQEYADNQQQKNLRLIDGDLLTQLMIKYRVGVESKISFDIFEIDNDYFV